ncbi:hypothetical protein DAEQUDRAFT_737962 [Daedalea quercina L-15889]|uniref:Uncharacterized protein n=1 Tax=Daedalea quercina L-15889 TaxID=1314783 RepID=A0A165QPD3_9APHY|nr:hypothetical protein DAEQUDRAFT_737962 [Daedalea quercina L-15889]
MASLLLSILDAVLLILLVYVIYSHRRSNNCPLDSLEVIQNIDPDIRTAPTVTIAHKRIEPDNRLLPSERGRQLCTVADGDLDAIDISNSMDEGVLGELRAEATAHELEVRPLASGHWCFNSMLKCLPQAPL